MSDPAAAARFQRASALEEKRRKLDELKKKREVRSTDQATTRQQLQTTTASNLDEYIDDLLKDSSSANTATNNNHTASTENGNTISDPSTTTGPQQPTHDDTDITTSHNQTSKENGTSENLSSSTTASNSTNTMTTSSVQSKQVETFSISTQTEEEAGDDDDENEQRKSKDENDDDTMEGKKKQNDELLQTHKNNTSITTNDDSDTNAPKVLSVNEVEREVTKQPFSMFINTASKKVERMLLGGASTTTASMMIQQDQEQQQDLFMVDYVADSMDMDNNKNILRGDGTNDVSSKFVQSKYIYECPKWTNHRDVTDLDWSPIHRELLLSTYHSMNNTSSITMTAQNTTTSGGVQSKKVDMALSSSLTPRSGELLSDGLALIWSPMLPNRPEHVFTCGSPVTCGKFHPTDPTLIIGGCHSGQLVIWDIRSGRLPVQKSSIPTTSATSGGALQSTTTAGTSQQQQQSKGHHAHAIGSMEILDGGLSLITASADGRLNFWSMTHLRDPAESIQVGDSISCFAVLPESETIVVGDEHGTMYTVASPNTSTAVNTTARVSGTTSSGRTSPVPPSSLASGSVSGGGGIGQRVGRRQVKRMDIAGEEGDSNLGHYGMITAISAKLRSSIKNSSSSQSQLHMGTTSKGFLRGTGGLLVSSGVDWTVKLWAPAFHSDKPLLSYVSHSYDYMSDVAWSTTHPSLFATASSNGSIGLYNLATSLDEPITGPEGIVVQPDAMLSGVGLNKIKWSADGRRIAVASSDQVHILNLSDDVTRIKGDEETKVMNQLLSRGLI